MRSAYVVLLLALILTGALWHNARRIVETEERARLARSVLVTRDAIERRIETYVQVLRGAAALFTASESLGRDEFRAYFEALDLQNRLPGMRRLAYAMRVPGALRARHEASLRQQGFPEYTVRPDGERPQYFPSLFIEPFKGPATAGLGLDEHADPVRRAAMERARDTGQPAATERILLLEDGRTGQGAVAIFVPVYAGAKRPPATVEERRAHLLGFVSGLFRGDELQRGIFGAQVSPIVDFEVFDGGEPVRERLLFDQDSVLRADATPESGVLTWTATLDVAGRTWSLYFTTRPEFHRASDWYGSRVALAGGLVVSALLFGIAWIQVTARAAVERVNTEMRRDMAERKRAEEALTESEARHRGVLESALDAIITMDHEGRIREFNPAAESMFGHSRAEAVGQPLVDLLIPPALRDSHRQDIERYLETGEGWIVGQRLELMALRADGSEFPVEVAVTRVTHPGRPLFTAYLRDLSARRLAESEKESLESQLRQAQKMEAVGRLAGGVAHDFNNFLTVIVGRTELLLARLGPGASIARDVDLIQKTAERAVTLTSALLAFSRKQVLQPKILDLNGVLSGIGPMLQRLIGEHIRVVVETQPELGRVRADPGQIEQVLVNLVANARDAMPEGGQLAIGTANVELDENYARTHPGARPGPYVMLTVSDSGVGIIPEVQAHIFEPFYTTKERGKGTGLGLATVYGIIKQSGGYIWVESTPGQGATFTIYLPRVDSVVEPGVVEPEKPMAIPSGGAETVLLAEDEAELRDLVREILTEAGYTVLDAINGVRALEVSRLHEGPIDLLLTDVVMPEMGGRELAQRLASLRPGLKVLYMSGYTDDPEMRQGIEESDAAFLPKPFTPSTVAAKVREVLARLR